LLLCYLLIIHWSDFWGSEDTAFKKKYLFSSVVFKLLKTFKVLMFLISFICLVSLINRLYGQSKVEASGHGSAVSLQLIGRWLHFSGRDRDYFGVGKRHCRVRRCRVVDG
jgi:hypothetical protein